MTSLKERDSHPTGNPSPGGAVPLGIQPIRKQRRRGITAGLLSLGFVLVLPFLAPPAIAWMPVLLGILGLLLSASYLAGLSRGPGERELADGRVTFRDSGMTVQADGRDHAIARDQIAAGWCEPTAQGVTAVLALKSGDLVSVQQPDEPAARALLSRAGVELAEQAVRLRLGRDDVGGRRIAAFFFVPFAMLGVPSLLGAFGYGAYALWTGGAGALAAALSAVVSAGIFGGLMWWLGGKLVPSWIRVGVDGLLLQKTIRKVFVPYPDVEVTSVGGGPVYFQVLIRLKSGKVLRLPAATRQQADAVVRYIEVAAAAFSSRTRAALLDGLARGGRAAEEWKGALHGLMAEGNYRARAVDAAQLLNIVEDPGLPADVRVGAAVALRAGTEPAVKRRIRVAAEASASPPVRVALHKAAEGEFPVDELAELEAQGRSRAS